MRCKLKGLPERLCLLASDNDITTSLGRFIKIRRGD